MMLPVSRIRMPMDREAKMKAALYAGIIGDALGVPAEHTTRHELSLCAVKNVLGYGRYDQPEGTWSDDTAMSLCTMESLCKGYDLEKIGATFCRWLFESYWTATGYVFDSGITTFLALDNLRSGRATARDCGCGLEDDNGNGSLMRILPAALYFCNEPTDVFLGAVHDISQITHAHPRVKIACGIYSLFVRELLGAADKHDAYRAAMGCAADYYESREDLRPELKHFARLLAGEVPDADGRDIRASGYVIDTLEAGVWCFLKHEGLKEILLAAVDLGLDTDTTGMAAGGLGGLRYGLEGFPPRWLHTLARKSEIDALIDKFVHAALNH